MKTFTMTLSLLISITSYGQTELTSLEDNSKSMHFEDVLQNAQDTSREIQPFAQRKLAQMFYTGEGTEKDLQKSFDFFKKSAQHGILVSNADLGYMYYDGEGTAQDYVQAFNHLRKALGYELDSKVYYYLGRMYFYGQGTETNKPVAAYWMNKAKNTSSEFGYNELAAQFSEENDLDL